MAADDTKLRGIIDMHEDTACHSEGLWHCRHKTHLDPDEIQQGQMQSPEGRAPCSDTVSGLTGWEATLLEKPGVLVDCTVAEG